jgi:hypothetical protein
MAAATWQTARDMVQQGRIRHLREEEKHFWVASVSDGEDMYEAEVIITPQSIKAFACECRGAGSRLMCAHVAATLLRIRQFREQRDNERRERAEQKAAAAQANSETRLKVPNVLSEVSPEALADFVKEYARQDRDFALALKTWFAGTIEGAQNAYIQVLDSALPRAGTARDNLRDADFRRFRKTLDTVETQLEAAFTNQNYRQVLLIATALIEKIGLLYPLSPPDRQTVLLQFCQNALQKLGAMPQTALSPELRDERWLALLKLMEQQAFAPALHRDAIRQLVREVSDQAKFDQLYALYDRTDSPIPTLLVQTMAAACAERQLPEGAARILEGLQDRSDTLKNCIVQLYYLYYYDAAVYTAEYFLAKITFTPGQRRELEDMVWQIADRTDNRPLQMRYLSQRFTQNGALELYQRFKAVASVQWPEEYARLRQQLEQEGRVGLLAAVLLAENDREALTECLREADLSLLERYAAGLDDELLYNRFYTTLAEYLKEHFGPPAALFVRETLQPILAAGKGVVVKRIVEDLIAEFPDRLTLPEELDSLLPPKRGRKEAVSQVLK